MHIQMALELCGLHLWMKATLLYSVFAGLKLPTSAYFGCFFLGRNSILLITFRISVVIFGQETFFTRFYLLLLKVLHF